MNTFVKPTVFISFASTDLEILLKLVQWLDQKYLGAITFFSSNDITGGSEWWQTIKNNLLKAKLLIFIATKDSITRLWCMFEAGFACSLGIKMIPITFGDLSLKDIPHPIQFFKGYDLTDPRDITKLLEEINNTFNLRLGITPSIIDDFQSAVGVRKHTVTQLSLETELSQYANNALNSDYFLTRISAIKMISLLGTESAIPLILGCLQDTNSHVRSAALESLAGLSSNRGVNLVSLLINEVPNISIEEARDILAFIDKIARKHDVPYLDKFLSDNTENRPTVIERLQEIRKKADVRGFD